MNKEKMHAAISEANRFIQRAQACLEEVETYPDWNHPRHTGAVRRASMDLTRALADFRKADA